MDDREFVEEFDRVLALLAFKRSVGLTAECISSTDDFWTEFGKAALEWLDSINKCLAEHWPEYVEELDKIDFIKESEYEV